MVKSENVSLFGGLSHLGPQPVINQSSASDAFNECSNNSSQEHQLEASHERSQQKNNPKKSGSFLNKSLLYESLCYAVLMQKKDVTEVTYTCKKSFVQPS